MDITSASCPLYIGVCYREASVVRDVKVVKHFLPEDFSSCLEASVIKCILYE